MSNDNFPDLALGVTAVEKDLCERVVEYRPRLGEADAMLSPVRQFLASIPLEFDRQY